MLTSPGVGRGADPGLRADLPRAISLGLSITRTHRCTREAHRASTTLRDVTDPRRIVVVTLDPLMRQFNRGMGPFVNGRATRGLSVRAISGSTSQPTEGSALGPLRARARHAAERSQSANLLVRRLVTAEDVPAPLTSSRTVKLLSWPL